MIRTRFIEPILLLRTEKRHPETADIQALEAVAGPKPSDMQWDEYACAVVKEAVAVCNAGCDAGQLDQELRAAKAPADGTRIGPVLRPRDSLLLARLGAIERPAIQT